MPFSINSHAPLLLFILAVSPLTILGFTQSVTFASTFGSNQWPADVPGTILFSDVGDSVDTVTEESAAAEELGPKKQFRRERHTVFVGNLPFDTTDDHLKELFSSVGSVELVSIPINKETGQPRGFAFVDLGSKEEVKAAIDNLAGSEFGGRTLRVNASLPKDEARKQAEKTDEGAQKIYVGNLPFDATRKDVEDLFTKYGNVRDVYLPMNRETKRPRGFAFVTLDEETAGQAIDETNGMEFLGRPLVVSLPLPPGEKGARKPREARQKLYIGNLSFYTVAHTLREVFEEFGDVFDCYLPVDPETGGSRGFGFVTIAKDAAEEAINATDGCEIDGRMIRVNKAQPKVAVQRSNEDWADEDEIGRAHV